MPNLRHELLRAGRYWLSSRAMVTPITENHCRTDFCAAWNFLRWLPLSLLLRPFALMFLNHDKRAMERQAVGLRHARSMMLRDDADTSATWYVTLKAAYLAAPQNGGHFDHPLKEPVTLRWRT